MFNWWKKISSAHRSDDSTAQGELIEFLFPNLKLPFFIRMGVVAAVAAIRREMNSTFKMIGVVVMQCVVAWLVALIVYQLGMLF